MGVGREAGRAMRRLLQFPGRETVAAAPPGGGGGGACGEKRLSWGHIQQDRSGHHVPGVMLPLPRLPPAGP